jgi:hypothetical protein
VIGVAAILGVVAAIHIPIRIALTRELVFKSSGVLRPCLAIGLAAIVTGRSARAAQLLVVVAILSLLPVSRYFDTLPRLGAERHPLRSVRDCIRDVQARVGGVRPGLYVDTNSAIWHPTYYYLRRIQPWTHQETPLPAALDRNLHDPAAWSPSLVAEERYRAYTSGPDAYRFKTAVSPPLMTILEYILFLPGPYTACSAEAALHGLR